MSTQVIDVLERRGRDTVNCLGQMEKCADRNYPGGGGRCVKPIFSTKVATNIKNGQGKSNRKILFIT